MLLLCVPRAFFVLICWPLFNVYMPKNRYKFWFMWVKLIAQKRRAPRPTKMRVEASMQKRFLRGRKPKIIAPQRAKMRVEALDLVGVTGFEPAASTSQMSRATNCATPRNSQASRTWGDPYAFLLCPTRVRYSMEEKDICNIRFNEF